MCSMKVRRCHLNDDVDCLENETHADQVAWLRVLTAVFQDRDTRSRHKQCLRCTGYLYGLVVSNNHACTGWKSTAWGTGSGDAATTSTNTRALVSKHLISREWQTQWALFVCVGEYSERNRNAHECTTCSCIMHRIWHGMIAQWKRASIYSLKVKNFVCHYVFGAWI